MGYYDDYLEHHGIKGQKWGVRRFENKAGHLTAAGKKRYDNSDKESSSKKSTTSTGSSSEEQTKKKGLSDKQKKALAIGAAVVGTAVVAYGGYKLYQLNKNATEGMASRDKQKSAQKFTNSFDQEKMANKVEAIASGYLSGNLSDKVANANYKSTMESANTIRSYAKADLEEARSLANKAANKDYSVKEKADYIREQYKAVKAPSSVNDQKSSLQWQRFSSASKANDDLVSELLKKNASLLASF